MSEDCIDDVRRLSTPREDRCTARTAILIKTSTLVEGLEDSSPSRTTDLECSTSAKNWSSNPRSVATKPLEEPKNTPSEGIKTFYNNSRHKAAFQMLSRLLYTHGITIFEVRWSRTSSVLHLPDRLSHGLVRCDTLIADAPDSNWPIFFQSSMTCAAMLYRSE